MRKCQNNLYSKPRKIKKKQIKAVFHLRNKHRFVNNNDKIEFINFLPVFFRITLISNNIRGLNREKKGKHLFRNLFEIIINYDVIQI